MERWALSTLSKWRPLGWAEERGQIMGSVGPFLVKEAMRRRAYIARKGFASSANKRVRAQSIRGHMAMHGLYVPVFAPWYPDFESEVLAFDSGKFDDQVDAVSLAGQIVDVMIPGRHPKPTEPEKILSTNPGECTVTLNDMFEMDEKRTKRLVGGRIR